jgi:NitT/TauT family transport system substrate-binding protein/putative hydroxymethylpyrimidine transport system substrate-binding protein
VQVPGARTDAVKNLLTGRSRFAILDIHQLALARQAGKDVVAVLAIADEPLAAIVPRGTAQVPDPGARRVPGTDLVAGSSAFFRAAGLATRPKLAGSRPLRAGDRGTPAYPELLLVCTRSSVQDAPATVRATVIALQRGIHAVVNDPESGVGALTDAVPGARRDRAAAELDAVSPAFQAPSGLVGTLDLTALRAWARWEQRIGVVRTPPEVADMFIPRFAEVGARKALEDDG